MKFRHEWKHEINRSDLVALRQRLQTVMQADPHAVNGCYQIRSLYFDNMADKVLREKIDGVNRREKFRLRYYNADPAVVRLEKKSKLNGLCAKQSAELTHDEAQAIMDGFWEWMPDCERPQVQELYSKMRSQGLRPKTIVDYTREPFIFAPGNVRVTIDYDIRTSLTCESFLRPDHATIPVRGSPIILEVKWDEFLPSIIRDVVQLKGRHTSAFSKYAFCRIYG